MKITIPYDFTTLNEYISAERSHRYLAAEIKKRETEMARMYGLQSGCQAQKYPVSIICHWYKTDARTDPDNIQFGIKFILDGFVLAGVLRADNWKAISKTSNTFELSNRDYVVVEIVEPE